MPRISMGLMCACYLCIVVLVCIRNAPPIFVPEASKICALTLSLGLSPPMPLLSVQEMTKAPDVNPATTGESCLLAVLVLARNSPPTLFPEESKSWAFTLDTLLSPPRRLLSAHVITNPPDASSHPAAISCAFCVVLLTRNSDPIASPPASNICALIPEDEASGPTALLSTQLTMNPPEESATTVGLS